MLALIKQRLTVKTGGSLNFLLSKRVPDSFIPGDDILGKYVNGSSEERLDLFLQYRDLREEFSILDEDDVSKE